MTAYDPIYLTETEHSLLDHADVPGVPQPGASVDWSAVEAESISLEGAGGDSTLSLDSNGAYMAVTGPITLQSDTAAIRLNAAELAFFGTTPAAKPTGVAVTAEAIHAALVALHLIAGP